MSGEARRGIAPIPATNASSRRMIERTGVQPHAVRRHPPRRFRGDGEEMPAKPAPGELVEETEVRDLDPVVGISLQLEIPGEGSLDRHQPDRDGIVVEV